MAEVRTSQTGLGSPERQASFHAGLRKILDNWSTLNGDQRLAGLREVVNAELAAVGVTQKVGMYPGIGGVGASTYGKFLSQAWAIALAPEGLKQTTTPDERAELADTISHETRHAEQCFRTANVLGGKSGGKRSPEEIAKLLNMDGMAVSAAVKARLKLDKSEEAEALEWAQSFPAALEVSQKIAGLRQECDTAFTAVNALVVEFGNAPRDKAGKLVDLPAFRERFERVRADYEGSRQRYLQGHKLYLFLAHERDAWPLGAEMNRRFGGNPASQDAQMEAFGQDMLKNLQNFDGLLK